MDQKQRGSLFLKIYSNIVKGRPKIYKIYLSKEQYQQLESKYSRPNNTKLNK